MKIITIDNNKSYQINNLDDFNKYKDEMMKSINIIELKDKPPKEIINDILLQLFILNNKNKEIKEVDTHIIYKKDKYEYCMFVYRNSLENNNDNKIKIITRLIDNSYQTQYNENNSLNHNNKCVICKIDGQKIYDITKEEIIEIIQYAYINNALIITPDNIINHYYKNNPVYGLNGYDVYTTIKYMDGEIMIFLNNPELVVFENEVDFKNKQLYKGIFNIWNVFKEKNKIPINVNLLISFHKENINVSINEEFKEKIIDYLTYKNG